MRHNLYDCFWDSGWKKLGCIYVWTSGGKTLCSVKINHFMPAPDLRPTDWLSPWRAWHTAIVGLNLRISSSNLMLCARPLSVYSSIFFSSAWTGSLRQLQFVFPCLGVFWCLSKMPVTLTVLALARHLKHVGVVYMVLTWSNELYEFRANLSCGCFSCTSKASLYDIVYFKGLVYSFYM